MSDSYAKDRVKTLEGLHAEIAELEKKYFDVALLNTELREQLAAARELGPRKSPTMK